MSAEGNHRGRYRYLLIMLLGLMWVVVYFQRSNIGMLLVDGRFLEEMGLVGQTAQQGLLMTVFLLAYSLANWLSVPISNRLGPRKALILGIIIASLAMAAGGWMGAFGLILLMRALIGVGHGIQFPNLSVLVNNWFPPQERGTANAIYGVGGCIGPMLAIPLFTWVNSSLGWEFSFFIPGILGLMWLIPFWLQWISDKPADNRFISRTESAYIAAQPKPVSVKGDQPSRGSGAAEVIKIPAFGLLCVMYIAFLCSWWGLMTWMPQYLVQARDFDMSGMANQLALVYMLGVAGILSGGRLVDKVKRKSSVGLISLSGVAVSTLGIAMAPSAFGAVVFMALAVAINEWVYPTVWATLQAMLPDRLIATGSGIMSGTANLFSAATPFVMGFLIQVSGSYLGGLFFLVAMAVLGLLSSVILFRQGY